MREAIRLARMGFPAPNPHVGCVIVKDETIVGRGYHHHAGGPHAEAVALAEAGELSRGSDVYVTLEPCNHTGRTPPCAHALVRAGVKRVFVANLDPNPTAAGGVATLQAAGIQVFSGVLEEAAEKANFQFLTAMRLDRPVVTVKVAMSLDGRIATERGESKWITGPEAREFAHRLRVQCGCVLVGYKTVLADDPELTARIPDVVNQPVRVVIDPDNRLTGSERVFNAAAPTVHLVGRPFHLLSELQNLFRQGVRGILVEGGAGTIQRFVEADLVDEYHIIIAFKLLGTGLTWTGELRPPSLAASPQLSLVSTHRLGQDVRIWARPDRSNPK
jgi:diaminohydroxyphosphoribosylaminopyrimidine deaminase/5-amino-6-(5-phosphoribosylamino)uracil reductase